MGVAEILAGNDAPGLEHQGALATGHPRRRHLFSRRLGNNGEAAALPYEGEQQRLTIAAAAHYRCKLPAQLGSFVGTFVCESTVGAAALASLPSQVVLLGSTGLGWRCLQLA